MLWVNHSAPQTRCANGSTIYGQISLMFDNISAGTRHRLIVPKICRTSMPRPNSILLAKLAAFPKTARSNGLQGPNGLSRVLAATANDNVDVASPNRAREKLPTPHNTDLL